MAQIEITGAEARIIANSMLLYIRKINEVREKANEVDPLFTTDVLLSGYMATAQDVLRKMTEIEEG